ncbi:metallophosphoesterase family protein [Mobilitalea sibirica]|uniref:Metallophosphoesterase family protein n=1 Tax=Mobilitalea sibirica TaxID=1462919 RepID=A0A8J7HCF5_9FIRM|nr:metallophosphoesterase [Mobilitalea sibirica]MBH1940912.1 metallophosphoesterase family protein [Mobilitalea sibirica]
MKYAIISDIHGNAPALLSVLEDARNEKVDGYIFAGDYYADFPYPNEVVDTMRNLDNSFIVSGNKEGYLVELKEIDQTDWVHNQFNSLYWNYKKLRKENLLYLQQLQDKAVIEINDGTIKILLLHDITNLIKDSNLNLLSSSKYAEKMERKPFNDKEFAEYIEEILHTDETIMNEVHNIDADIIVFGHSHVQWHTTINNKILINSGSCGLPLDYKCTAAYTIVDIIDSKITIEERRVAYDIDRLVKEIKSSELYECAKGWCDIIIGELNTGRDDITFFFHHAWEVARELQNTAWPFDNDIWAEAVRSWFEESKTKFSTLP